MRKRVVSLLFVLAFFIMFASADTTTSENDREIFIEGCSVNGVFASVHGCIILPDGSAFYCAAHNTPLDAFNVAGACAKGQMTETDLFYRGSCCPRDGLHHCDYLEVGVDENVPNDIDGYYCRTATKDCMDYPTKPECEEDSDRCYWDEDYVHPVTGVTGTCLPTVGSCYEYTDSAQCDADPKNVSQNDPNCRYGETESAGIPYTISQESCECYWDDMGTSDTSDDRCGLHYNITSTYGDGSVRGVCEYFLELSPTCVEGFQNYTYIAEFNNGTLPVIDGDARCTTRTGRKRCGEPVVKVPFFSILNLFIVVFLVGLFYLIRTKFNVKDRK